MKSGISVRRRGHDKSSCSRGKKIWGGPQAFAHRRWLQNDYFNACADAMAWATCPIPSHVFSSKRSKKNEEASLVIIRQPRLSSSYAPDAAGHAA